MTDSWLFLVLDLTGVFAFALNGSLTGIRLAKLDIVGVLTLGVVTALGGGIIRDIFIDSLPPATFSDWRYLTVGAAGGLTAFVFGRGLDRLQRPIMVLDAVGLSLFAVTGATKALDHGMGPGQAVILGTVTAVGGGTIRDMLIGQVPVVLRAELYAIPAMVGAFGVVVFHLAGAPALPAAVGSALACFAIRLLGVRYDLHAPGPPERPFGKERHAR